MSKTPRTDAAYFAPASTIDDIARAMRQLERELAAAKERIRKLEEAGNALDNSVACGCGIDGPCKSCRKALHGWQQAKETQP